MSIFVKNVSGRFELWIRSGAGENPCGDRLYHGGKFPVSKFVFDNENEAEQNRKELEDYLKSAMTKKHNRKGENAEQRKSIFG